MIFTATILGLAIVFVAIVFWLEPVGTPRDEVAIDDADGMGEGPEA